MIVMDLMVDDGVGDLEGTRRLEFVDDLIRASNLMKEIPM